MTRTRLLRNFRPARGWLIISMCLSLAVPVVNWVIPTTVGTTARFEVLESSLATALLDNPCDFAGEKQPQGSAKTTAFLPPAISCAYKETHRPVELKAAMIPHWIDRAPPLFLPRPPPSV